MSVMGSWTLTQPHGDDVHYDQTLPGNTMERGLGN